MPRSLRPSLLSAVSLASRRGPPRTPRAGATSALGALVVAALLALSARAPADPGLPSRAAAPGSSATALPATTSDTEAPVPSSPYVPLGESAWKLSLESAGLLGLVTFTGFHDWKWGSSPSFRINSEGWFGLETGSGGMDKLGHFYGAYMTSEFLYLRLRDRLDRDHVVTWYPFLFASGLYLYIEFFDAYSVDHGWSFEDVVMDAAGAVASLLRNTIPVLGKTIDFRLEYIPSPGQHFHPVIDYEGQKFFAVFKPAGLERFERTPWHFLEIFAAYSARGFSNDSAALQRRTDVTVGVGLSLEQLLFAPLERRFGFPLDYARLASTYFQAPYTYAPFARATRRGPSR